MADKIKKQPSLKQQRFIDCYDGDLEKAAKTAGISYGYARQLMVLPKHAHIIKAIKERELTKANKRIKTREERQEFWSDMMDNDDERANDRLKASELLGKSEADFVERKRLENADGKPLKWQVEIVKAKDE